MSEQTVSTQTIQPLTRDSLTEAFRACGVHPAQTLIVHTSLRSLGWVVGGVQAYIQALLDAIGPSGTVMMPTQTFRNLDSSSGSHPGVPENWWPLIRAHWPAYDSAKTPSVGGDNDDSVDPAYQPTYNAVQAAGIPVVDDTKSSLMHNTCRHLR